MSFGPENQNLPRWTRPCRRHADLGLFPCDKGPRAMDTANPGERAWDEPYTPLARTLYPATGGFTSFLVLGIVHLAAGAPPFSRIFIALRPYQRLRWQGSKAGSNDE